MKQWLLSILVLFLIVSMIVNATDEELTATQNEEVTVEVYITSENIDISNVKIKVTAPDGTSTTSPATYNSGTGKWEILYSATSQLGTYKATAIITDSGGTKHYSGETSFTIETNRVTITYRAGRVKAEGSISANTTGEIHIAPLPTDNKYDFVIIDSKSNEIPIASLPPIDKQGYIVIDSKGNPVRNANITAGNNITFTTDSDGIIIETDKFKFINNIEEIFNRTESSHKNLSEENTTTPYIMLTVYTDGTITKDGKILEGVSIINDRGKQVVRGMPDNVSVGLNFVDMTYEEYKNKTEARGNYDKDEFDDVAEMEIFNENGTLIGNVTLTPEISRQITGDKLIIHSDGTITDSEGNIVDVKALNIIFNNEEQLEVTMDDEGRINDKTLETMRDNLEYEGHTEMEVFDENNNLIGTIILTPEISRQITGDKLIIHSDGTITDSKGNIVDVKALNIVFNNKEQLEVTMNDEGKIDERGMETIKNKLDEEKTNDVIDKRIYNESIFPWYYLLPLLLIPLILFFVLKENKVVSDLKSLQEAKKQGKLKFLNKFNKVYVTSATYAEVKGWNIKNIKKTDAKDEIVLATKLNIKKILTENPDREKIARSRGFEVFNLGEI